MQMELINSYARGLLCLSLLTATPLLVCSQPENAVQQHTVRFLQRPKKLQEIAFGTLIKSLSSGVPLQLGFLQQPCKAILAVDQWASLWKLYKKQFSRAILQAKTVTHAGMFTLDGNSLVTCTQDCKLNLWDLSSDSATDENSVVLQLEREDSGCKVKYLCVDITVQGIFPRAILVPAEGGRFYLGLLGKEIQEWEYAGGRNGGLRCLARVSCLLDALVVSPCGRMLLIGLINGPAILIEASKIRGEEVVELDMIGDEKKMQLCDQSAQHGLSFSADGRWAAISSKDGSIEIWDVESRPPVEIRKLIGHRSAVVSTTFHPQKVSVSNKFAPLAGMRLLSAGDTTVKLWDLQSGLSCDIGTCPPREFPVLRPYVPTKVEFSRDGTMAVIIYESSQYEGEHRSEQTFGNAVGCIDCATNTYFVLDDEEYEDRPFRRAAIPALHPSRKTLLIPGQDKTELIALQDYDGKLSLEQLVASLDCDISEKNPVN